MKKKNIIFNIAFALACLISVCLFWKKPILLTIILATISLIGLSKWKNKETFILFILAAISGAFAEAMAIYFNVWTYALPNIIGVPCWLFILWGNAAIFIYQMAIEIKNII